MDFELTDIEVRVLGCLIEKELATPEYYPLSMKALLAACNQKSSRDPVMTLSEDDVHGAILSLKGHHLAWEHHEEGARVPKYSHNLSSLDLDSSEIALLGVLMLRGAQTPGEIRAHIGRMYAFESLEQVEATLRTLNTHECGRLTLQLPRQPGRKEARHMHLLSGEPDLEQLENAAAAAATVVSPTPLTGTMAHRVEELQERVETLESQVEELQKSFKAFRSQFE